MQVWIDWNFQGKKQESYKKKIVQFQYECISRDSELKYCHLLAGDLRSKKCIFYSDLAIQDGVTDYSWLLNVEISCPLRSHDTLK